jgi:hypothetical protein
MIKVMMMIMMIIILSAIFNVEANTEITKENLSSLSSSSSLAASVTDTDCMITRAIVHTNNIGVLNNVEGNKDFDDMIYMM